MDPALFQENERTAPTKQNRLYMEVGDLHCESGGYLPSVTVAFEAWGTLNRDKSNAILICHAVSGDSHAIGWWSRLIGPGLAIDTNKYFVVCSNALGGCQGTTGPTSRHPDGKPWASRFPMITVGDMVEVQMRLMDILGIPELLAVVGGSMGGMQAIEWSVRKPGRVRKVVLTASTAAHSAMQIGFNEAARQAILRDAKWQGGDYDPSDPPAAGLAVARMIGHLTYLSESSFDTKFGRRLQGKDRYEYTWAPEFEVESYLNYQGSKFTQRFDANSFLVLTRAIDYYSKTSLAGSKSSFLVISYTSDWLYPTGQSISLETLARSADSPVRRVEIDLPYGHDSFLLDGDVQGQLIENFLSEES